MQANVNAYNKVKESEKNGWMSRKLGREASLDHGKTMYANRIKAKVEGASKT